MLFSTTPPTFGRWVRTRRRQLDLTQAGLGKRVGCSEAAIRKIEADERRPSRELAELLSRALEIPGGDQERFLLYARGILLDEAEEESEPNRNNLPVLLTSTIDRKFDLAAVCSLLEDNTVHLVTVIGPPGIGKTRLSIHCGNELLESFPNGVWFVDLAEVQNPDFFLSTLARSLPGLDLPPSPSLDQLISRLRDKRTLLILDNFEQIVDQSALTVAQILKACSQLKILVTSRVPLHIYGEHEYALPPLSIPAPDIKKTEEALLQYESVQLFLARTRQHQPQFRVTPRNAGAIIDICTVLEGIPLALELAAATLRQMSLEEMALLLRGRDWARQIATPARDLPQRQRTLENVIDWSYALLYEEQRETFKKLGLFAGWFDAGAAAAICETEVLQTLNELTDRSLLERETLHGRTYWRMLELIHVYAVSKLHGPELSVLERRRAEYFSVQLRAFRQQELPQVEQEAYYRIHIQNLLAAFRWSIREKHTEIGFHLAKFLDDVWASIGYLKEGLELIRQLMALPDEANPRLRADRLQMASDLAWQLSDFDAAIAYSKAAADLGRVHALKDVYPWYLNRLGRIYIEQEQYEEARLVLQEALDLASASPELLNPGIPLAQLGEIALFESRLEDAKLLLEKALTSLENSDAIFLAMAWTDLAQIDLAQKNFPQARKWLEQAYEPARQHIRRTLVFLCALAGYLVLSGRDIDDIGKAAELYGAVDVIRGKSGIRLNSFYQRLNQMQMELAQEKLSAREWQRAFKTGSNWERDAAIQQARHVLGL